MKVPSSLRTVNEAPSSLQVLSEPVNQETPWSSGSVAGYYWHLIVRDRWRIATFVIIVTIISTLIALALPKQYDAMAQVRVDPTGVRVVGQEPQSMDRSDSELLLQTERDVIVSPNILVAVIRQLHLDKDPELGASIVKDDGNAQMDKLIREVTKRISIDAPVGTLLLQVHFRSHSPQIAADTANALVTAFIEHEYATRADALHESSKYMSNQLGELRAAMERDQQALVDYQSRNDVLDPDNKENIFSARLSQINADLSDAQSVRMKLEAAYEAASRGDIEALIITGRGQSLQLLRQRLVSDQRQLARLSSIDGVNHPLYREQQQLVTHDQNTLQKEAQRVEAQVEAQYREALIREQLVQRALDQQKRAMDDFNRRAIRYRALKAAADSSSKLYYDLMQRIQDANVAAGLRTENLRMVSSARVPVRPVFPRIWLTVILTFILSTGIGAWASVAFGMMDRSISRPEQLEQLFHIPVLGSVPLRELDTEREKPQHLVRRTPFEEAILSLRSTLLFAQNEADRRVIAVTSAIPSEGKSTVAAELARAIATTGSSVVLVDCDLRKPSVHRLMKVPNRSGLGGVLRGSLELNEAVVVPEGETLRVLPAGSSRTAALETLHASMTSVIERLRLQYDYVVIDCPPVLGFADIAAVGRVADGVILVIHAGKTSRDMVSGALRQLASIRAEILGAVLNRVSVNVDNYYQYYSSEYYSGYAHEDET